MRERIRGVAATTLVATLATAPRVDIGILIGTVIGIAATVWESRQKRRSSNEESKTEPAGRNGG